MTVSQLLTGCLLLKQTVLSPAALWELLNTKARDHQVIRTHLLRIINIFYITVEEIFQSVRQSGAPTKRQRLNTRTFYLSYIPC